MSVNKRIKDAVLAGVKAKTIATNSGVSYFRVSSVVNPKKYRGESKFNDEEAKRINDALDKIAQALAL